MKYALLLALALPLQQSTPTGGNIAKLVPPIPTPASFISDERGVLDAAARAALDSRIGTIQSAGLGDIAVAILPSVGGYSPNQVAVEIYRTWKVGSVAAIGSARRNVGVLMLIVPKELAPDNRGQCWINTGTGSEGIITDATAGSICRDSIIPHLKERDYAGAIGAGITAIELRLRGDTDLANAPQTAADIGESDEGVSTTPVAIGGGILAFLLGLIGVGRWRRNRARACPRCGRPMRRLDEKADDSKLEPGARVEEKIGSIDYDVWACDCGGSMVIPYRKWFSKYSECPTCHRRAAAAKRKTIVAATTSSMGSAEDRFTCRACGAAWAVTIVLPQISESSSSSSGGGGGGGGGGSSFGGSGSTSGGGGGGSY